MTELTDFLISVLIIGVIILIFYLKITKKQFKDLIIEIKDIVKEIKQND